MVCGDESTGADPDVAPYLVGLDVTGADEDVAARIGAALDRALAGTGQAEPAARAAFARGRYAWSAAADRYAELLDGLIGERARVRA